MRNMSLDRKLVERCRRGRYRQRVTEQAEVFKVALGSLQSEREAAWECYPGPSVFTSWEERQGTITGDWEEMVRAVGEEPGDRGGVKVSGEVETFFPVRWFSKGQCRGPAPSCPLCLPFPFITGPVCSVSTYAWSPLIHLAWVIPRAEQGIFTFIF